jgi:hypothetical protein
MSQCLPGALPQHGLVHEGPRPEHTYAHIVKPQYASAGLAVALRDDDGRPAMPSQSRRAPAFFVGLPSDRPASSSFNDGRREEASMKQAKPYLMVIGTTVLLLTAGCAKQRTPGTTTTTLPSTTGTPVIVSSGAPSAGVATAGAVHHVINGEVTDVDRNSGKVNIRASDGSKVQVILPPLAVATANKGDRASIDVQIGPAR